MPVHVLKEANRCLQCKKPRCRELGCPIQTNIPEVIRLFKENKMMEAAEILFENNPLSVVCSLVCNHEGQCEGHCIKGMKGEPVHFSSIENYISDSCFERLDLSCAPPNGMKVGVVGAGPAGITIAIQSSSALTVMLVGLVNSGVMELGQTVGVIMGSNIGTTLTAWIQTAP